MRCSTALVIRRCACLAAGRLERRGSAGQRPHPPKRATGTSSTRPASSRQSRRRRLRRRKQMLPLRGPRSARPSRVAAVARAESRRAGQRPGARQAAAPLASPPGTGRAAEEPRPPTRAALRPAANGGGSGDDRGAGGGRWLVPRPGVDGISFTVRPWGLFQLLDWKRTAGSDPRKASCRVVWASRPIKQPRSRLRATAGGRRRAAWQPRRRPGPPLWRRRQRRPRRRNRGQARIPWRVKQPEIASTALLPLSSLI